MATPSSQATMLNKLLELLYSSDISQMSGGFDPRTLVDEDEDDISPLAKSLINSADENVARVFSGLVGGQLDPISAKAELSGLADSGAFGNMSTGPLFSAVDSVFKETTTPKTASSKKKDKYREAGLPDPLEMYRDAPEFAPMGEKTSSGVSEANQLEKIYAAALSSAKRPKGEKAPKVEASGVAVPDYLARSLANMSPEYLAEATKDLAKSGKQQKKVKAAYLTKNVEALESAGRTPYKDALGKNAMLLKAILGK